jgi:hypothetical protein
MVSMLTPMTSTWLGQYVLLKARFSVEGNLTGASGEMESQMPWPLSAQIL